MSRWPGSPNLEPDLSLSSGRVDLWVLTEDAVDHATELVTSYRALLTEPECEQERRFRFPKDRHRYLLTRTLVRTAMSRYVPIAAADWRFVPDRYGRPLIVNDHALARELSFNVSHTDGIVVLAITSTNALGVDVETVHREAPYDVASQHFSAHEYAALKALPESLRRRRFFELWTLKESYVKARGLGLSIPLKKLSFDLDTRPRTVRFDADFDDVPARWIFFQPRLSPRHITALCLRQGAGTTPSLTCRQVVPLIQEQTSSYHFEV
jgi:4'-phosphopantetheinyl transferase